MTKVVLFHPTNRKGGLDIFEASIRRQTVKPDLIIVADQHERKASWLGVENTLGIKIIPLKIPIQPGNVRNLAETYNHAAALSVGYKADLFISLQDYIWIPEYGIERFIKVYKANPESLITGLTHISKDPSPDEIADINGAYTIFKNPYYDRPKEIAWQDVRQTEIYGGLDPNLNIIPIHPDHWEANWAAVPVNVFEEGIKWDEEFDKGIAYENADFARSSKRLVLMDTLNEAISLPHKMYWPTEEEEIIKYSNRWLYENKWDI